MRVFINDLSIDGGFPDRESVADAFKSLMKVRNLSPIVSAALHSSRMLPQSIGYGSETIATTIAQLPRDQKQAILIWMANRGPFIDDDRLRIEDDLFYHGETDVTDQGLGEAARWTKSSLTSATFSFARGSKTAFDRPVLDVLHGMLESPFATYGISNIWEVDKLEETVRAGLPEPTTWTELLRTAQSVFGRLVISDHVLEFTASTPFSSNLGRNVLELLNVLDRMKRGMSADGALDAAGEALRQQFFVGSNAWFSDESVGNKREFSNEMNFPDPTAAGKKIVCFWHGKIQTPQFRVHFEWPVLDPALPLKVAYIGPKISKR